MQKKSDNFKSGLDTWQVEAVGRLAVTAPAGGSGVQCEPQAAWRLA
ncbi:MAG: hypothetical protein PHO37_18530 [Kiritimatiellae bacterium]|nr:hypothetical protein [Kiritimatiellia bacterium]